MSSPAEPRAARTYIPGRRGTLTAAIRPRAPLTGWSSTAGSNSAKSATSTGGPPTSPLTILDHDTAELTAHYAWLHDTTVREHWEKPRNVNISEQDIELDPDGLLAEAAWSKQRLSAPPRPCRTATAGCPSSSPARTQMPA
ncbi:hypothetical protein GCM10009730_55300 [Streptomyces albidochromogenes]